MLNLRSERFELAAMDKPAVLVQRSEMHGAYAEEMRVALASMGKQELRKAYESVMAKRYAEAQLAEDPKIEDDRSRNTLVVEVRYAVPNLFNEMKSGEGWTMPYLPSNMTDMFAPPGTARRSFPLAVPSYPARVRYDLEVRLPDAFNIAPATATRKVDDSVFSMQRKAEVERNRIRINVQVNTTADRVPAPDVPQHYKNLQQYNEIMSGTLNAFRSDMAGAAQRPVQQAAAAAGAQHQETEEDRIKQLVDGTSRAIAKAEASGRDPIPSLCERAVALAWLGRQEEALKDTARGVQLQPSSSVALRCRADVNFALGRFKESEADYSKLIARGNDEPEVHQARGLASLYLGKLPQAQADLRLAMGKLDSTLDQGRAAIWLQLAGGTPATVALDGDAAWLRDVSAMLEGKSDPEQMISRVLRNAGSGIDARLVEAYFYIGRRLLASGERLKAKSYFQRAVNKRLLDNLYHIASRHELSRMDLQP
jgi:tetratricopeptide (TPR) repeat protein